MWHMASRLVRAAGNGPLTRPVPIGAQNSQGGLTQNFYHAERVIEQDLFWVCAILSDGRGILVIEQDHFRVLTVLCESPTSWAS
jgi:hypothetical protein